MSAMESQITSVSIAYSTDCSGADKIKSNLCVAGLCEGNWPVAVEFSAQSASNAERFLFDDVIMLNCIIGTCVT